MKSKKRSRAVTNVADWQDKWIDVLALRDLTLGTDPTEDEFARTVVKQLRKAYGVEFNTSQVTRKLDRIWDNYGRYGPKRPNLIYQEGSDCLENLDPEAREEIEKRRNAIAHEQFVESLSQRTTRSASRCGGKSLLPFDIEASPSPRKKARAALVRQSPCPGERRLYQERLQDTVENKWLLLPKQESRHTPPDVSQTQSFVRDSFEETNSDGGSNLGPDESSRFSNNVEVVISHRQLLSDTSAVSQALTLRPTNGSGRSSTATQTDNNVETNESLDRLEQQLCNLQKKYNADTAFYRTEMQKAREEVETLKRDSGSWVDICDAKRNGASLADLLRDSEAEKKTLHDTLKDRKMMQTFSSLSFSDSMPLDRRTVNSQIRSIGDKIKSLADYDDVDFEGFQPCKKAKELGALLSRAFPCVVGDLYPAMKTVVSQALKLHELIRTLVAAAVCSWVFEAPLQFLSGDPPCMLLRQYRWCLEKQDGNLTMRNLDFAAHSKLLEDDFFQKHIIPTEAQQLTNLLCQTLKPLFEYQQHLGFLPRSSLHRSGTTATDYTIDDRSNLEEIFEIALKVKARLLTSTDEYEAIMHAPGSAFSRKTMRAENSEGEEIHPVHHEKIKCCYLPSIVVYKRDRQMVGHNNFIRSAGSDRSEYSRFTMGLVVV